MAVGLLPAYGRIFYKSQRFNRRTVAALKLAQKRLGLPLSIAQGSYNTSVEASGSTHSGGGAVDLDDATTVNGHWRLLTDAERIRLVHILKDLGFAAWFRRANWDGKGSGSHIHALLIGDREMSGGARSQVLSYDAGRNGLTNNAFDDTYRAAPRVRFSYLQGKPVPR